MKHIDAALADYLSFRSQDNSQSILLANLALIECLRYVESNREYLIASFEMLLEERLNHFKPCIQSYDASTDKSISSVLASLRCFQFEKFSNVFLHVVQGDHLRANLFLNLQASLSHKQDYHMAALLELLHYTSQFLDHTMYESTQVDIDDNADSLHVTNIAECLLLQVLIEFARIERPIHQYLHRTLVSMHQAELYQQKNSFSVVPQYQVFNYYVGAKTVSLIELSMILALIDCDCMDMVESISAISKSLGSFIHHRDDVLGMTLLAKDKAKQDIKNGILNYVYISLIQTRAECLLMSFDELACIQIDDAHLSQCIQDVNLSFEKLIELVRSCFDDESVFLLQLQSIKDSLVIS